MSLSSTLAASLSHIRNGQDACKKKIKTHNSKLIRGVLDILKREGYIENYMQVKDDSRYLIVKFKYHEGKGVIHNISIVSKPSRRVYTKAKDIKAVANGLGLSIISTSKGIVTDYEVKKLNVGGEILCKVF